MSWDWRTQRPESIYEMHHQDGLRPANGHTWQDYDRMLLNTLVGHTFAEMGFFLQSAYWYDDGEGMSESFWNAYRPLSHTDFQDLKKQSHAVLQKRAGVVQSGLDLQ